jgi:hypothetical protein
VKQGDLVRVWFPKNRFHGMIALVVGEQRLRPLCGPEYVHVICDGISRMMPIGWLEPVE